VLNSVSLAASGSPVLTIPMSRSSTRDSGLAPLIRATSPKSAKKIPIPSLGAWLMRPTNRSAVFRYSAKMEGRMVLAADMSERNKPSTPYGPLSRTNRWRWGLKLTTALSKSCSRCPRSSPLA
jgi:hypothetical protein